LRRSSVPIVVRFDGMSKKTSVIDEPIYDEVKRILLDVPDKSKKHIVFVDGFAQGHTIHDDVYFASHTWMQHDKTTRRLVVVCSMSTRYNSTGHEDEIDYMKEFKVYSWDKQEYFDAVSHNDFFASVQDALEENSESHVKKGKVTLARRRELVESKYHYAGGCSRFMFQLSSKRVSSLLIEAMDDIDNMDSYKEARIGQKNPHVVNRLFSKYPGRGTSKKTDTFIVSSYAGNLLAERLGPDFIEYISKTINSPKNPAFDGWLFEFWFFACLNQFAGVELYANNETKPYHWSAEEK